MIGRDIINKVLLLSSFVFGAVGAIAARKVYDALVSSLYRPVVIMLTIGTLFAIIGIANILFHVVRGIYSPSFSTGAAFAIFAVSLLIVLLATLLFEFIYELGGGYKNVSAGAYAIIIDDSGSMDGSDPTFQRYDAIDIILEDRADDFPYAVYRFSDSTECIRELLPKSDGNQITYGANGGGTSIKGALETVLKDYKSGILANAQNLKVLLLSDGGATDIGFFSPVKNILNEYCENDISISTVGLGSYVDESLMTKIAKSTGGVYLNVADVSNLADAMTVAIESYAKRDLLTYRSALSGNVLLALERILFMGIIGSLIGAGLVLLANGRKQEVSVIIAVIKGFIAAVILEVSINSVGLGEKLMDCVFFVLVSIVVSWVFVAERPQMPIQQPEKIIGGNLRQLDPENVFGKSNKKKEHSDPKSLRKR